MVLRVAFWLTALLFLLLGLNLYWLPQQSLPGTLPLWLVRGVGGLLTAWGMALLYAGYRTDPTGRVLLVGGNLLVAATLGAAALRLDVPELRPVLLALTTFLLLTGLTGLVAAEASASRVRAAQVPQRENNL